MTSTVKPSLIAIPSACSSNVLQRPAGRERLGGAETEVAEGAVHRVDAADEHHVAAARFELPRGQVHRRQRRGACGIHREVQAAEIEAVGDAARPRRSAARRQTNPRSTPAAGRRPTAAGSPGTSAGRRESRTRKPRSPTPPLAPSITDVRSRANGRSAYPASFSAWLTTSSVSSWNGSIDGIALGGMPCLSRIEQPPRRGSRPTSSRCDPSRADPGRSTCPSRTDPSGSPGWRRGGRARSSRASARRVRRAADSPCR